ncbi:hypothetical protein M9434_006165 [Picochlorum sp. BPE23]|nr:hypothetical protein M9434_006165 [Picochlorum sp. BPE23]
MTTLRPHSLVLALAFLGCAVARDLLVIEFPTPGNEVNASVPFDPNNPFTKGGQADIPMSELAKSGPEFAPDQIHIGSWTPTSMRISWATGAGRLNTSDETVAPYDPDTVTSTVKYGTSADELSSTVTRGDDGVLADALVYMYKYNADAGDVNGLGTEYHSPILHHVVLQDLSPGQTYFYSVGSDEYGFSDVYNFTVPSRKYPFKFGVMADIGQTYNTSVTLERTAQDNPDALLHIGDLSYADDWLPNGTAQPWFTGGDMPENGGYFLSYQPKWDTFARLTQPFFASVPHMSIGGNHELESVMLMDNVTNMAYNARYPNPQDAEQLNTSPNYADLYWDQSRLPRCFSCPGEGIFVADDISSKVKTNNTWYSVDMGPAHIVMLNNYVPYSDNSVMYKWFDEDLSKVDREQTPWIVVGFHSPWYHTYINHYKENSNMQEYFEPLMLKHKVDVVLNGHVHAYARSPPVYEFKPNTCGPLYMTVGDGGNLEGLYKQYVDEAPTPKYCGNSSIWRPAEYQPTYSGKGVVDEKTPFCYAEQPPWSDYRDPSFGHGLLTFINDTAFQWQWNKNVDSPGSWNDDVIVLKNPQETCGTKVVMGTKPAANANAKAQPNVMYNVSGVPLAKYTSDAPKAAPEASSQPSSASAPQTSSAGATSVFLAFLALVLIAVQ